MISWSSSKQRAVSRSSTESVYRAVANGAADISWLESILHELSVPLSAPPVLLCDNLSATYLAANPVLHARTKHVEIDHHFVHDKVMQHTLLLQHTHSEDQLVDAMTKALPSQRFLNLRCKLTVVPLPMSLRGDVKTSTSASL